MRGEMETETGDTVTILRLRTENHIPPTQIISEVWTWTELICCQNVNCKAHKSQMKTLNLFINKLFKDSCELLR